MAIAFAEANGKQKAGASLEDVQGHVLLAIEETQGKSQHEQGSLKDMLRANVGTRKIDLLPWGWPSLDRVRGGIPPASLITVGAHPGVGKTMFALSVLEHLAMKGIPVDFYSVEMNAEEVMGTIIGRKARVSTRRLRAPLGWKRLKQTRRRARAARRPFSSSARTPLAA
jgi:replicative DNA helicase